jgi:hypothetical protein
MGPSVVIFFSATVVSVLFLGFGWGMAFRLAYQSQRKKLLRPLLIWTLRGVVLPGIIWMLMNIGLSWNLQPFMPDVQWAKNSGKPWFPDYLEVLGRGFFLITSYWAAITLAWSLWLATRNADRETLKSFKSLCLTCFLGMIIFAVGIVLVGGMPMVGFAAIVLMGPVGIYGPSVLLPAKTPPMYARAVARMKFGKYDEAEWEIIRELEKREDDFEGWMMMADLYANHFHDLHEAEQTVLEICDQKRTTTSQLSVALHRLADWQLNLGNDPEAARRALHMICTRLPGSHLAHMAQLRINQLPHTQTELKEHKSAATIPLPALGDSFDTQTWTAPPMEQSKAIALANGCVEELKANPNNVGAREKLARTFAEQLQQPERGIEQLHLLLNMSEQPNSKRAEWLGLTAVWHLKFRQDPESGRRVLEQVMRDFPGTPQAFSARRRLELLERERKVSGQ